MKKTFQKSDRTYKEDYFKPLTVQVTNWSSNPSFLGARSINKDESSHEDLKSSVKNLFFAGDAYSLGASGTFAAASKSG